MARRNSNGAVETPTEDTTVATTENEAEMPERSAPITVGPERGGNVLAAWRGIEQLFGGQVERWDVLDKGIVAVNFTVDGKYDPEQIVEDISGRDRRVELVDAWPILAGGHTEPFTEPLDMTKWMQQFYRKVEDGGSGKSPDYVKSAISDYKKVNNFPARKGRPKKVVRIEQLGAIDESLLVGINVTELEKLQAKVAAAIAAQAK